MNPGRVHPRTIHSALQCTQRRQVMKLKRYVMVSLGSLLLLAAASSLLWRTGAATGPKRLAFSAKVDSERAAKDQLTPQALPPLVVFTAQLTPFNEVPPVTNADVSAVGEAVITLHVTQDSGGNITAAGGVVVDSGISPASPVPLLAGNALFFRNNLAVSTTVAQDLVANPSNFYFNVHTNANPGGAVRGQLAAVSTTTTPIVFTTLLSPANEVPPVTN